MIGSLRATLDLVVSTLNECGILNTIQFGEWPYRRGVRLVEEGGGNLKVEEYIRWRDQTPRPVVVVGTYSRLPAGPDVDMTACVCVWVCTSTHHHVSFSRGHGARRHYPQTNKNKTV